MHIDVSGKVVVITGATRGIGRELAVAFAQEKAKVVINYAHNKDAAEQLIAEINNYNLHSLLVQADITNPKDVSRLYSETIRRFGRVDILINNAGICDDNLIQFMSESQWQRVIDVNLTGTFLCCRAFSKAMLQQHKGKIIVISSLKGQEGCAGQVNYAVSKAGLIGFAKTLAKELGQFNIAVNIVCPGFIVTDLNRHNAEKESIATKRSVLQCDSMIDVLVNFIFFLAWDKTNSISGQVFNLDSRILI